MGPREVTALIGPNGAGKTTFINCLTGLTRPDEGSIRFDGQELVGLPPHRIARLGIVRTFQNLRLFPRLTVLDNVLCGLSGGAGDSFLEAFLRTPAIRHRERRLKLTALDALDTFGLADHAGRPAGALSYGDKKRLELAITLGTEPELLLLDEPTCGMSPEETESTMDLIRKLCQDRKITILFTEHDMAVVFGIATRLTVLHQGRLIADGTPEQVRESEEVQKVYLGGAA